ncbi:MAG: DUF4394 domain-containing protein, partial [Chthoniobacteraceae bacterium]
MKSISSFNLRAASAIEPLEARIAPAGIVALTGSNELLTFDSATPGTVSTVTITGLAGGAGENIEGIDFRPASGQLFALGIKDLGATDEVRVYTLDPATGIATIIPGSTAFTVTDGTDYGFDFNPTVDRIRVVNDAEENFRINPDSGARVDTPSNDTDLTPAGNIVAAAYDRNFIGGTSAGTTLFALDSVADSLVTIGGVNQSPSPNGGAVQNSKALGVDIGSLAGFDIQGVSSAFAALTVGGVTSLYAIDLGTGAATSLGSIGAGVVPLKGLSVQGPQVTILPGGKSATFTDVDGDLATVKTSVGAFGKADFNLAFVASGTDRGQLTRLTLSDDGPEFVDAKISISAAKKPGGDGLVNVGFIDATGLPLNSITIKGDLGQVEVGNTTAGLKMLDVRSMGRLGMLTQGYTNPSGIFDLTSISNGPLGTLKVAGDITEASVRASGPGLAIGSVNILGSLIGGALPLSGLIYVNGKLGPVKIGGDLIGGGGDNSGSIQGTKLTSVVIGSAHPGSIRGGAGFFSGSIFGATGIGSIKITGSLHGDVGFVSGNINSSGNVGPITIGGDMEGNIADQSGRMFIAGNLASLTIGGS